MPMAGKGWTFFNLADNLKFSIGEKAQVDERKKSNKTEHFTLLNLKNH